MAVEEIRELTTVEFCMLTPHLVDIYIRAMGYDPTLADSRVSAWRHNSRNRDFHAFIAVHDRSIVGVVYGFRSNSTQWWFNQVYHGVRQTYGAHSPQLDTLNDYVELSEIHVDPAYQGRGIGRRLIKAFIDAAPTHILLSTPETAGENNRAFGLYRSLDFQDLLRNFRFLGDSRPFAVLYLPTAS
ncbi:MULTISPECIES: GNAT family N-acetyltransferase [Corynebacterium]|uniref:GNAT family N-acetyltransferase n=1 Tax=Corynebacterium TaxID=1716 RepID=UPI00124E7141|nr:MULTISPECIES: GNAT family N-acetyltransferase [Corynebacterium]